MSSSPAFFPSPSASSPDDVDLLEGMLEGTRLATRLAEAERERAAAEIRRRMEEEEGSRPKVCAAAAAADALWEETMTEEAADRAVDMLKQTMSDRENAIPMERWVGWVFKRKRSFLAETTRQQ